MIGSSLGGLRVTGVFGSNLPAIVECKPCLDIWNCSLFGTQSHVGKLQCAERLWSFVFEGCNFVDFVLSRMWG